jgi:hypothetical protein
VRGRGCRLYGTIDRTQLASQGVRVRTSEHVRQLEAPTKSDDYLLACIIPRDEPMRVREDVRELFRSASVSRGCSAGKERRAYGFNELVPEWAWTYELVYGRRVLCEEHELAIDILRDTTVHRPRQQRGLRRLRRLKSDEGDPKFQVATANSMGITQRMAVQRRQSSKWQPAAFGYRVRVTAAGR